MHKLYNFDEVFKDSIFNFYNILKSNFSPKNSQKNLENSL